MARVACLSVRALRAGSRAIVAARPPPPLGLEFRTVSVGGPRPQRSQARCFSSAGSIVAQAIEDFGAESITEGTLMEWKKKAGDSVAKGEVVAVVETDKVTLDVNAQESGVLQELLAKVEDTVVKGQLLFKIAAGASASASPTTATPPTAAAPATPAPVTPDPVGPARLVDVVVKDFGAESITEGALMEWKKGVGEFVNSGELLAVVETDKVTVEVKAEEAGVLKELLVAVEGTVEVGKPIATLEAGAAAPQAAQAAPAADAAPATGPTAAPAPVVGAAQLSGLTGLRLAFARNAALRAAAASGLPPPVGAPTPVAAPSRAPAAAKAPEVAAPARAPKAASSAPVGRGERRVPMTLMRQRVLQRMKDTQNTAALLTTFQEADMSVALDVRKKHKEAFEKKHGVPLGLLSLFVKACAGTLREVPAVNAVIDDESKETVYRNSAGISVPIPSPRGPVSCVLRSVETMSVLDIELALSGLVSRAATDELTVDDMVGATFGITDAGAYGGMLGTALINPPQSAVLGTHVVKQRAVLRDGKVVARPVMFLSLTYDHRLIDGREAVTFLCFVRDKMEDPTRLLLDL